MYENDSKTDMAAASYITANLYLDIQLYTAPQLEKFQLLIVFQQNKALPHWVLCVRQFLHETFPNK